MNIMVLRRMTGLLPVLLTVWPLFSQQYQIGRMEAGFTDHDREDRVVKALILYPADSAGTDVPLALRVGKGFPVIVFGHGYMMPVKYYRNIWECTVPEGFVFVLPKSASGLFPSHMEFGTDLAFILDEMIRLDGDTSSIFHGKLQSYGCLMGHSMGGGSAVLGARKTEAARTLLVLSPLDTRPSSAEAARELSVPSLVIAGSDDWITPPENHQQPIYESLQSGQKTYIMIKGATHCQMAGKYRLCNFAEKSIDLEPGIPREKQHRILERYMLPWLKFHLYGDTASGRRFDQQLESDTGIVFRRNGRLVDHAG